MLDLFLRNHKYRILLISLLLFLVLMWSTPFNIVPLVDGNNVFKFALIQVIVVTMIVSRGIYGKSIAIHGGVGIAILLFTNPQHSNPTLDYVMGAVIIGFFGRITRVIVKTLLREKHISSDLLLGCVAGFIMIGISGFLFFGMLDNFLGNNGFSNNITQGGNRMFTLLYYSFVTLLTIGYGDIVPKMPSMQLATIIYALVGRSYSTFILAMVLKKFDSDYL